MELNICRLSSGGLLCSVMLNRRLQYTDTYGVLYIEQENAELGRLHSEVDGRGTRTMKPKWINGVHRG